MVGFIFGIIFLIAGIVTAVCLANYKQIKQTEEYVLDENGERVRAAYGGYRTTTKETVTKPLAKFSVVSAVAGVFLAILLTFFVFNFLLAGQSDRDPQANWRVSSISFHVILPIMYVFDWLLFYEHKKVRWFHPLVSVVFPTLYIIFVYTRAAIVNFNPAVAYLYPYFFLNPDRVGTMGIVKWVAILLAGFVIIGYIFYGIDKIVKSKR